MKNKLFINRTLVLAIVSSLLLTIMCAVLVACNKAQRVDDDILSLYDIVATFDNTTNTLNCREEICFVNRENQSLDELKFHLSANAFREGAKYSPFTEQESAAVYYAGVNYGGITIENAFIEGIETEFSIGGEDENLLIIPISKVEPNKSINVEFSFAVKLPQCNARMGITQSTVNLGNFYPVLCVFEDGEYETHPYYCFGDPFYTDSADFLVTLNMPEEFVAATSGEVEKTYVENGIRTFEINAPKVRDFAATLSKNFNVLSDRVNDVDINYFYTEDLNAETTLATAKNAIETFSNAYGEYPYPTFNVAQTGLNSSGMEYSNIVFINAKISGEQLEETLVHETAHQWWYGVVGGNQIKSPWLDEGLTEFSTAYYFRLNGNKERYTHIIADTLTSYTMFYDTMKATNPDISSNMNRTLADYTTLGEYVIMNYHKATLMYASLLDMYGEQKINKALSSYYSDNKFKIATPENLIESINAVCKGSDSIIQSWLDGTVFIG